MGGSIFDDFFDASSAPKEEVEKKDKKTIDIDFAMMIEQISDMYCNKGYAFLSLVLSFENHNEAFRESSA